MSSIAMLGAGAIESLLAGGGHGRVQKFKQDFQQLGQDLQSGNIAGAQSDLAGLQPANAPGTLAPNTVSQGLQRLTTDLQSGNVSAAEADYVSLQQVLEPGGAGAAHGQGHGSALQSVRQEISVLGQALQSGNLSAAQAAYASLQAETGFASSSAGSGLNAATFSTGTRLNVAA
jgi:hypothetical protein